MRKLAHFFYPIKKKRVGLFHSLKTCFFSLFVFVSAQSIAQTFPPASSCTSKDLLLVNATLPYATCETCTPGTTVTKPLTLYINNKTGSTRTSFAFWATLKILNADGTVYSTTSISKCFSTIPKNATTPYLYGDISFPCGKSLLLTDIWEAWTDASPGSTCAALTGSTSTINPKCGTVAMLNIIAGDDANYTITDATCTSSGSIKVAPIGGTAPYTVKLYDAAGTTLLATSSSISAGGSYTFSNLSAATYTFKITDNNNCAPVVQTRAVAATGSVAAPTSGGDKTECQQSPIQTLTATATGGTITWYTAATGGSVVASPTLSSVGTVTYYAQASNGTCTSARTPVTLTINAAPAAPTSGGNQTQCEQSPIQTLTATATGGTITWYTAATSGSVVASPTLSSVGTVTYYAEASNGTCSSLTRTAVTLTINAAPAAPTSGGNQTQCEQSPIQTLTATATGGTITWYTAATGGSVVANPTLSSVGTVTYYAQASNGTCPSLTRTAVTLTINAAPAAPTSGGNQTQCEQSPIQTLTATATGGTITWYTAATGGSVVASPTLSSVGTVTYYAQASNGTCSSLTRTAVTLTINAAPAAPTSGGNQTQCEQSPIQTLTATATGGTITWYTAATGGSVVANPTLSSVGTVTYYAQASNGTCSSLTRTAVTLTINAAPAAPISGGNQTQCEQSPIQTLTATATGGTITWYTAATGGSVVASPTLNSVGTVTYYAQASNGTCSSLTRTAVTLTINEAPAAPTSGGNQTQCEQSPIQTLTATATGGTITWYTAATGGSIVASPTLSSVGTVTYYAQASDGTCSSLTRTAVTLTINAAPAAPTSGGNQTQCEQSPIQTLTASATGGTITWYDAATGGNVVASPTKNTLGSVTYYAQASNGTCSSLTRTPVTLTINAAPAAPTSGGDQTECEQSPIQTLTATATGGTITWYNAATGGSVVAPTLSSVGTVTYYAQASNGTCSSLTRTAVTLTINPKTGAPTPTFIGPSTCTETTYSVSVASLGNGTYTLTQPGEAAKTFVVPTDGSSILFTGLILGKGYSVTFENTSHCVSEAATCGLEEVTRHGNIQVESSIDQTESQTTVKAYPNPFSDRIKFVITSPVAGKGNLDVYNMMGQRVKTVYTGFIAAGTQTFELSLSTQQIANLVYVLRIGDKKLSGKILQINK